MRNQRTSRSIEERKKIIPGYSKFDGLNYPQVLEIQAEQYADKDFFVHGDESITFRQFNEAVDNLAAALKKKGLKRGEPCGLLLPNGIKYMKFQFAILKMGAVLLTLDTRHRAHEIIQQIWRRTLGMAHKGEIVHGENRLGATHRGQDKVGRVK